MKNEMLIFDLDDTLIDTYSNQLHRLNTASTMVANKKINSIEFKKRYGIPGFNSIMSEILDKHLYQEILSVYYYLDKHINYNCFVSKSILTLLKNEYILIIISNSKRSKSQYKLSQDMLELFDKIYFVEDLSHPKPDTGIIKSLLDDYKLLSSQIYMFGDTETDFKFAQNANINYFNVIKNGKNNINKLLLSFLKEREK